MIANISEKHAKGKTKYYGKIDDSPESELLFMPNYVWTYIRCGIAVVSFTNDGTSKDNSLELWEDHNWVFKKFETRKSGTVFTFTQL